MWMAAVVAVLEAGIGSAQASDELWAAPLLHWKPRMEVVTRRDGDLASGAVAQGIHRLRWGGSAGWGAVEAHVAFQYVGLHGDMYDTGWGARREGLGVSHAWLAAEPVPGVRWKVGRQEVSLHGERLVTRAEWSPEGQRLDGVRLEGRKEGWGGELMAFRLPERRWASSPLPWDRELEAWGGGMWIARGGVDRGELVSEGVALVTREPQRARTLATAGLFSEGTRGDALWRMEGYGQWGVWGERKVQAWMLSAEAGWRWSLPGKPVLRIGYDFLSGDGDPEDPVFTRFDTLYGADHRYYGTLDIAWRVRGGEADDRGLHDARMRWTVTPAPDWELRLDGHAFATPVPGPRGPWLGLEADAMVTWRPDPHWTVSSGAMAFLPLDRVGLQPDLGAWLQVNLRFDGRRR